MNIIRTFLALLVFPAHLSEATEVHAEPALPIRVFQKLQAGGKQTVVTYGTSLTHRGAWTSEVKSYFDQLYPGQVEFHNAAKSGMHSKWGLENLESRVLHHSPDLVFIEFSANDASLSNRISLDDSRTNLDQMVKAIRNRNPDAEIVLQTMNPAWDSPRVPKTYGSDRPELSTYYDIYRTYAAENHLPLADHEPYFRRIQMEQTERYQKMVPDGIHPSSTTSREVTWQGVKALFEMARNTVRGGRTLGLPLGAEETIEIWPEGQMPGKGARGPESLRPANSDGFHRVTNVSHPTLSLFPVSGKDGSAPLVIVCPGGGYGYLVIEKEGSEIARWLNSFGFSAAVLKYRTPHNREGAFQDLQRAIRLVRTRAADWKIDPKRVGVIGFSAGGHLAARAGSRFDVESYQRVDSTDEQSLKPDFAILVYPAYLDDRKGGLSPDPNPRPDLSPTLIIHNEDDSSFFPGTKFYVAALQKAKARFDFSNYPTGGHGYALHCQREAKAWPGVAEKWLSRFR